MKGNGQKSIGTYRENSPRHIGQGRGPASRHQFRPKANRLYDFAEHCRIPQSRPKALRPYNPGQARAHSPGYPHFLTSSIGSFPWEDESN